ncbi:MAG: insulinase family protein [Endomicrobium sp.]|nr:insulinase family protein [Endomicrobium sp.]
MENFILKNNVKIVFNKTSGADVVALRVVTSVSVVNEILNNAGISYITSKLMIRSTKNRSNEILINDIENIGAQLYAFTDYDISGFCMTFTSEYFNKAVEILSDVVLNPTLDDKNLFFEKQKVIAILKSRKDNIGDVAYDEFIKLFYYKTPYAVPVFGTNISVKKISRENVKHWYEYSYNSSNILISVSGNINKNVVKKSLEKYFSLVPDGMKSKKSAFNNVQHYKPIKKEIDGKFDQSYIYMGFQAPSIFDLDFIPMKIANTILGGKMSSRLFIELRENFGLAYEVGSIYPPRVEGSYFAIYVGLDKKNIDLVLDKIYEILKNFCVTEISDRELKDAKIYIKSLYAMERQTVNKQSYYYGWREIIGQGYEYDTEYLNDVNKISTKDILNITNKIFSKYPVTIIINSQIED